MTAASLKRELLEASNPQYAKEAMRFFKCGKGQYGEGDKFLGISVPETRKIALRFKDISLKEIEKLLTSKWHEMRSAALFILVSQFEKGNMEVKEKIVDFYLTHRKNVNNWDLVDLSAYKILGEWLINKKDRKILYALADSKDLWSERIAVVSTFAFIREKDFKDILKLSQKFLSHKHDLMHKACGWMLREAGKREKNQLIDFLNKFSPKMPRTMLRYAIEKLDNEQRELFLTLR